ncbi:hypothetical protein [Paenibacillus alvei]|uniref:hypothetical protein n=1 Tax=Paenibacillus alvei TaxID=44250 RepID=UPI0013DD1984|nr:hypothetical protein [Paenibacillus alvei]NEZ44821.1 hypothetical protein [Paenibacillus alvei]
MSRDVSHDGSLLISYLKQYNLSELSKNQQYITEIKVMHKKAYGYLLFIAELTHQNLSTTMNNLIINFYQESGSDMMQSIFNWANGSYKASKFMLRSSIETFVKACVADHNPDIFEEKSLYKVFDIAKNHHFFTSHLGERYIDRIYNYYKVLCMTAHSTPTVNLASVSSMKMLPRYDAVLSQEFVKTFTTVVEFMLCVMFLSYSNYFYRMHDLNQTTFLSTMSLMNKREIQEFLSQQAT